MVANPSLNYFVYLLSSSFILIMKIDEINTDLQNYNQYLNLVQQGHSEFNAKDLLKIIDSFTPILCTHFSSEITTLLSLESLSPKIDIMALWNKKNTYLVPPILTFLP